MAVNDRFNGILASKAIKVACAAASDVDLTLSGNQTVNGVSVVTDDRVLVRSQTNAIENGIYIVKSNAWERAADWDGNRDIVRGTIIPAYDAAGDLSLYEVTTTTDPIRVGTDAVTISFYLQGAGAALESGTITGAMLRWDGVDTWREADRIRATAQGENFQLYNTGLSQNMDVTYAGSSVIFLITAASHNFEFQNDVVISGADLYASEVMYMAERGAAKGNMSGQGQFWVDSADSLPYFTDDGGNIYPLTGGGVGGVYADQWNFDSTTGAPADPGAGEFRLSISVPSAVAAMYISESTVGTGNSALNIFSRLSEGMEFTITNEDRSSFLRYTIVDVTDNGTWWDIGTNWLGGTGSLNLTNGEACTIEFSVAPTIETPGVSDGATVVWDDSESRYADNSNVRLSPQIPPLNDTGVITINSASANDPRRPKMYLNTGPLNQYDWFNNRSSFGSYRRVGYSGAPYPTYWGWCSDVTTPTITDIFSIDQNARFRVLTGAIFQIEEKAAAGADDIGFGQIWVNSTDKDLYFTDEAGADYNLLSPSSVNTPFNIVGDTDGGSGNTGTALLQFTDLDESDVLADIGFTASDNFTIENLNLGGDSILRNNNHTYIEALATGRLHVDAPGNSGAVYIRPRSGLDDGIRVNPLGDVVLYYNDIETARTTDGTVGGFSVRNLYTGGTTERVLTESDANKGWPGSIWEYRNNIVAPPDRGTFNGDSVTASAITEFYFDEEISGFGVGDQIIALVKSGDVITFHRADSLNTHSYFRVTADPTDNTAYWTVPVAYIGGSGFTTSERYRVFTHPVAQGGGPSTPLRILGDALAGDPPGGETINGELQFWDSDESTELGSLGYTSAGTSTLTLENLRTSGGVQIRRNDGGTQRTFFNAQGGGAVELWAGNNNLSFYTNFSNDLGLRLTNGGAAALYYDAILTANTDTKANGGFKVYNTINDPGSVGRRVMTEVDLDIMLAPVYRYSTNTASSDPSTSFYRFNSVTLGSITEMYIDDLSAYNSHDYGPIFDALADGDVLFIRSETDPADWLVMSVTGAATDNTGWWTIPVSYVAGSAPTNSGRTAIQVQWSSQAAGGVAGGTGSNNSLYWNGSAWTESDRIRINHTDNDLEFYADDDTVAAHSEIRWFNNSEAERGFLGYGSGNADLAIRNKQLGAGVVISGRNVGDTADQTFLTADPDNLTVLAGLNNMRFSHGATTNWWLEASTITGIQLRDVAGGDEVLRTASLANGGIELNEGYQAGDTWQRVLTESQMDFVAPAMTFEMDTLTTMADPGAGDMRFNSATPASVTAIAVSDRGALGTNDTLWLLSNIAVGDVITVKSETDLADYWILEVTSVTNNTTWYQYGVTVIGSGALPTANDRLHFSVQFLSQAGGGGQTPWTADIDGDGFNLTDAGVIFLREQASADADVATQGQIWVESTATPSNRMGFTDEAGNDGFVGPFSIEFAESTTRPYGATGAGRGQFWCKDWSVTEPLWNNGGDSSFSMMNSWTDLRYTFDNATASADPGTGEFRMNNATPASVTALYISDTDATSGNHGVKWNDLVRGDIIEIGAVSNMASRVIRFRVNDAVTDNTAWVSIPVEVIDSGALFTTAEVCSVEVHKSPSKLQDYSIENVSTTPTGTTETLTYEDGPAFEVDLESVTGNITITLSGGPPSGDYGQIIVKVTQDSATARTITWAGGTFEWPGDTAHVMNATLDGFSIFTFETWDGGTTWFATGADYGA